MRSKRRLPLPDRIHGKARSGRDIGLYTGRHRCERRSRYHPAETSLKTIVRTAGNRPEFMLAGHAGTFPFLSFNSAPSAVAILPAVSRVISRWWRSGASFLSSFWTTGRTRYCSKGGGCYRNGAKTVRIQGRWPVRFGLSDGNLLQSPTTSRFAVATNSLLRARDVS